MSRTKKIEQIQPDPYLEPKLDIIDVIRGETLEKISIFFRKCGIVYHYLVDFLNNPIGYPGKHQKLKQIVRENLDKIISKYRKEIQDQNLTIKFVYVTILNQIFRGKK